MAKTFDTIVSDIINNVLIVNPAADVKIGEVIRDVFIDIQALQIENLYNVADNSARAQSVLTARAQQLDRLGYNFRVTRNPATPSSTTVTIVIRAGAQAPTPLNIGDQFTTQSDQNNAIQTFINTQLTLLQAGQTQVTLPVVNINPGSSGNVAAYTITQSSYSFADSVYNQYAATGGQDLEPDVSLAARIPLNASGRYLNTFKGIILTTLGVPNINGQPFVVTPDNPLSRGMYTTDVYLQRSANYFGTTAVETAPANAQYYIFQNQPLYMLNPINQVSVYDTNTSQFVTIAEIDPVNGPNYVVQNDPSDALGFYYGSTAGATRLLWLTSPPTSPYSISYNYDASVTLSQAQYDINSEITNDLLFKSAPAIPMYLSINLSAVQGTDATSTYQTAQTNLTNLFNTLSIGESITANQVILALLQDSNLADATFTNFDSTIQINIPANNSGPDVQSQITPFGYYFETDTVSPFLYYNIAARLWIGKPDVINSNNFIVGTGFNVAQPSQYNGVTNENIINNVATSWTTQIYPFFDEVNQVLILNFSNAPSPNDFVTLNLVQNYIDTLSDLNYLTIGPSFVSPIEVYPATASNPIPQYVTVVPNGITFAECNLYKNTVPLIPGSSTISGDYTIVYGPDDNNVVALTFTITPASTDILQFGLLNPDLSISYSTNPFTQ